MNSNQPTFFTSRELENQTIDREILREAVGRNQNKEWFSLSLPVSHVDPLAYIEQAIDEENLFYWEQPDQMFSIASGGAVTILQAAGPDRFNQIGTQSRSLYQRIASHSTIKHSLATPLLLGGYSFSDTGSHEDWDPFGSARFVLPEWCIIKFGKLHILTVTVQLQGIDEDIVTDRILSMIDRFSEYCDHIKNFDFKNSPDSRPDNLAKVETGSIHEWSQQVEKARKLILDGEFQKIVIARKLDVESNEPVRVTRALHYLRENFSGCYIFMTRAGKGPDFIGATPERLIALQKNFMLTEGLAGSISRGASATEDAALEHMLMESHKERAEHEFVVRDIRDNLKPFSMDVKHPVSPSVKKLDNVQHLYTPITAQVSKHITIHELLGTLHPTPAVGGYPREQAMSHIPGIETIDRGWYSGPIGWFNLGGSGEFAVAIRSALIDGKRSRLFAGCGIVEDSNPQKEWDETELKLKPVLDALIRATKS